MFGLGQKVWSHLANQEMLLKNGKNTFFVLLGCFTAYVRQPHDHIG